jgi:hypothetical protein
LGLPQGVDSHDFCELLVWDIDQSPRSIHDVFLNIRWSLFGCHRNSRVGEKEVEMTFLLDRLVDDPRDGFGRSGIGYDCCDLYINI